MNNLESKQRTNSAPTKIEMREENGEIVTITENKLFKLNQLKHEKQKQKIEKEQTEEKKKSNISGGLTLDDWEEILKGSKKITKKKG